MMSVRVNDYGTMRRHGWAVPFEMVLAVSAAVLLYVGNYSHMAIAIFLFVVSFLPVLIERIWLVRIPAFMHTAYVVFLFASMFSGEVLGMYMRFHPWDDIMHLLSGVLVAVISMLWLTTVIQRAKLQLSAWLYAMSVFCVSATVAVIWEVVEFCSDQVFGTFMQRNDQFDTMTDLIYGTGGAFVIAALLYCYLTKKYNFGLGRIVAIYRQLNLP